MIRRVSILAVTGAFVCSSVMAETININVYGRIRAAGEVVNGTGSAAGKNSQKQARVVDNSSVLGFKGVEDLGNGLSLLWQVESQLEADGDADGRLNSRNTFVSLKTTYGTILVGQNDSPYKQTKKGVTAAMLEDSTAEVSAIFGRFNSGSKTDTTKPIFYTRQNSTLQYISPLMKGAEFKMGLAPDENKTASTNKIRVSSSLGFENETFYVAGGFESRPDGVAAGKAASALMLNGGYKLDKDSSVGLGYEQLSSDGQDQRNLYLTAHYQLDDHYSIGGNFAKAGNAGDVSASGASMLSLGVSYELSKRTNVTAYYAQIKNQSAASYNFGDNSIDQLVTGLMPKVLGLGVSTKF